jgi:hypothetical protein
VIKIIDTRMDFRNFLEEGSLTSEMYKNFYYSKHEEALNGLAVTHLKNGLDDLNDVIEKMDFKWYEEQFKKLETLDFINQTDSILTEAQRALGENEDQEIECYLLYGFKSMTGCSTYVNGRTVLMIGLEWLAEYGTPSGALAYEYLLVHELFHVLRNSNKEILEECSRMALTSNVVNSEIALAIVKHTTLGQCFVDEGLASVAPAVVRGDLIDDQTLCRLLFLRPEELKILKDREQELLERAKMLFHSSDQNVIYEWTFTNHGLNTDVPERALYYLGAKAMLNLMDKGVFKFSEMTTMRAEEIIKYI